MRSPFCFGSIMHREFTYTFGKRAYDLSSRTHIMGVLNVTPDSFSDGGKYVDPEAAVARAFEMIDEGADIIDVGGESTRPKSTAYGEGAEPVDAEEEVRRVLPVIQRLARASDIPISIDTYKAEVARRALDAGATIVNDISGLRFDAQMADVVGRAGASVVIMHIKGTPKTMQLNPEYDDLFGEITAYLAAGIEKAKRAGVRQILIDPGIGFGKRLEHNLQLLSGLERFQVLGCPIVVGASRKSFIGALLDLPVNERLEGSLAAAVAAVLHGANIVRVHDVRATKRAVAIADALARVSATHATSV
jgi:dihydropteroate synthase